MSTRERLLGVDFGGPATAARQRRKIVGLEATRTRKGVYVSDSSGSNARLVTGKAPGFTAEELARDLLAFPRRVVAFDFPFSLPRALLVDESFAALVNRHGAFHSWQAFNRFVCATLPLAPPASFAPFAGWRNKGFWLKRATDSEAAAQPPLKDKFQVLFNMTLLGNALLGQLGESYAILPFSNRRDARGEIIEVYPGAMMRKLGLPHYKRRPREAIRASLALARRCDVELEIQEDVLEFCATYSSGSAQMPDHDGADALAALVCAILHREGKSSELLPANAHLVRGVEGAIYAASDDQPFNAFRQRRSASRR